MSVPEISCSQESNAWSHSDSDLQPLTATFYSLHSCVQVWQIWRISVNLLVAKWHFQLLDKETEKVVKQSNKTAWWHQRQEQLSSGGVRVAICLQLNEECDKSDQYFLPLLLARHKFSEAWLKIFYLRKSVCLWNSMTDLHVDQKVAFRYISFTLSISSVCSFVQSLLLNFLCFVQLNPSPPTHSSKSSDVICSFYAAEEKSVWYNRHTIRAVRIFRVPALPSSCLLNFYTKLSLIKMLQHNSHILLTGSLWLVSGHVGKL